MSPTSIDVFSDTAGLLLGTVVSTRAALLIRGARAVLVPSLESVDAGATVEIYSPGLEKLLDLKVGGWVGGPASYFDMVEVTGILAEATTRIGAFSLAGLSRLILERDGEVHVVI